MIIDILVVVVLFISAIIAFLRGFIREVLTIAGVVGGGAAAYFGGPLLKPILDGWLGVEEGEKEVQKLFDILPYDVLSAVLSYGLIFIVVVIILSFVSHYLAETVKKVGLGAVDRTFGFIFGLIRGILILGLLYLPAHLFMSKEDKEKYIGDAQTLVYLESTSAAITEFIPENMRAELETEANAMIEKTGAREKLEQIDLLKEHKENLKKQTQDTAPEAGYSKETRNELDRLIRENTEE